MSRKKITPEQRRKLKAIVGKIGHLIKSETGMDPEVMLPPDLRAMLDGKEDIVLKSFPVPKDAAKIIVEARELMKSTNQMRHRSDALLKKMWSDIELKRGYYGHMRLSDDDSEIEVLGYPGDAAPGVPSPIQRHDL